MLNGIGKRKRSEKGEGERTLRKEDGMVNSGGVLKETITRLKLYCSAK
jgi:hypothetical protein